MQRYTKEKLLVVQQFIPLVKSFKELSTRLGMRDISHLSRVCKRENFDTTHFVDGKFKKGQKSSSKFPDSDVFVSNSTYNRNGIKKRIIQNNLLPYVCSLCGQGPYWNNKPMPLILDHINGINNDNRLENLRFVCSNCDTQLDTYKSKNRAKTGR